MAQIKETKSGIKVEVVDSVKGGDSRDIGILSNYAESIKEVSIEKYVEAQGMLQDKILTSGIVSIDGESKNILDIVHGMETDDYLEVLKICSDLMSGFSVEKKTK